MRLYEAEKLVQGDTVLGGRKKIGAHTCFAPKLMLFEVSAF